MKEVWLQTQFNLKNIQEAEVFKTKTKLDVSPICMRSLVKEGKNSMFHEAREELKDTHELRIGF